VTFSPGVGEETSIAYRYVRRMALPYDVSQFPEEIHPAIFIRFLDKMAGGVIKDDAAEGVADGERSSTRSVRTARDAV